MPTEQQSQESVKILEAKRQGIQTHLYQMQRKIDLVRGDLQLYTKALREENAKKGVPEKREERDELTDELLRLSTSVDNKTDELNALEQEKRNLQSQLDTVKTEIAQLV